MTGIYIFAGFVVVAIGAIIFYRVKLSRKDSSEKRSHAEHLEKRIKNETKSSDMLKKPQAIKCKKCGLEFPDSELSEEHKNKAFIWDSEILCKDCLIMAGGDPNSTHTWWDSQHDVNKAKPHDW